MVPTPQTPKNSSHLLPFHNPFALSMSNLQYCHGITLVAKEYAIALYSLELTPALASTAGIVFICLGTARYDPTPPHREMEQSTYDTVISAYSGLQACQHLRSRFLLCPCPSSGLVGVVGRTTQTRANPIICMSSEKRGESRVETNQDSSLANAIPEVEILVQSLVSASTS